MPNCFTIYAGKCEVLYVELAIIFHNYLTSILPAWQYGPPCLRAGRLATHPLDGTLALWHAVRRQVQTVSLWHDTAHEVLQGLVIQDRYILCFTISTFVCTVLCCAFSTKIMAQAWLIAKACTVNSDTLVGQPNANSTSMILSKAPLSSNLCFTEIVKKCKQRVIWENFHF